MTPFLFSYLPKEVAEEICKLAAVSEKTKHIAKVVGAGALGTGAGYLTGALATAGADALHKKLYEGRGLGGSPTMMKAIPLLGAGAGLAYSIYKAQEMEELRRALESTDQHPGSR